MGENPQERNGLIQFARHFAREIEVLNPAVDRNGQRPDNCEYPWEGSVAVLHSPLVWEFNAFYPLRDRFGLSFVKVLKLSIDRGVKELN